MGCAAAGRAETETETEAALPEVGAELGAEVGAETETLSEGGAETEAEVGAEAGLGAGWTEELDVAGGAFEVAGAPSVIVHASAGRLARPLRLVVFLHGWSGCARQLAYRGEVACRDGGRAYAGWDLIGRFDGASSGALLVIPQLAFMRRSGSPGRFAEPGRFAAFIDATLRALAPRIGEARAVDSLVVLAHSAGYETALALIARGGIDVDHVVLFDALYRGVAPFDAWVAADPARRLISFHNPGGRTAGQSRRLLALADERATAEPGPLAPLVRAHPIVVRETRIPHGEVPAEYLAPALRALADETADGTGTLR